MKLYPVHPYTVWEYISRWAVVLLIPITQQLLLRPHTLWELIRAAGLNLAALVALILLSYAHKRAIGYRAQEQVLYYQRGLLWRRSMHIPYHTIDSITVKQTTGPSLFGASRLFLDTPAGSRRHSDVSLTLFRKRLWKTADSVCPKSGRQLLYRAGIGRILLMTSSWSNPGAGLLLLAPFINRVGDILGEEIRARLYSTVDFSLQLAAWGIPPVSAALAYVLAAGWLIAFLVQLFRYSHFHLYRANEFLIIRRGLINTSQRMFRAERISALSIRQTLFMRLFKLYSGFVHNIGSGKDKGDRSMLVAAASKPELEKLLAKSTPRFPLAHSNALRPEKGAGKSYLLLPLSVAGGFFLVLLFPYLFGSYSQLFSFTAVFAAPFFCWWAALRYTAYHTSGISCTKDALMISGYRRLTLQFTSVPIEKVQMVTVTRNPLQRRHGRCNVRVYLYSESREAFCAKQLNDCKVCSLLKEAGLL